MSKEESGGMTPAAAATPPIGAACWICFDGDPDEEGKPIVRDCSCRGDDAGFAHLSCRVKYAEKKTSDIVDAGEHSRYGEIMAYVYQCELSRYRCIYAGWIKYATEYNFEPGLHRKSRAEGRGQTSS